MSESPFESRVPAVFVPVTDLERSIGWYSRMLGRPMPSKHPADFYLFRLGEGGANLFLQQREQVHPSPYALFSVPAPDVDAACAFLHEHGIEVVSVDRDPDGATLLFKDPDGNVVMGCSI
jgi:catechol 2,3-dioxygenase-like lactoylglutathione lyase family enzyme